MAQPATCDFDPPSAPRLASALEVDSVPLMPKSRRAANGPASATTMNALARLIQSRRRELDLTWEELAARGGFTSHSIVYSLATKKVHKSVPRPETLKKLAKALGVPLDVVRAAAVEAAGYTLQPIGVSNIDAAADIRVVALAMEQVSEADRKRIARFVQSFLEDRDSQ